MFKHVPQTQRKNTKMEKKMTKLLTCHGLGFLFSHILFYYKIILACQVVLLLVQFPFNFLHHLSPISYSLSYTPLLPNVTWQIDMLFKLISLSLFLAPLVFPVLCFLMLLFSFFACCTSELFVIQGGHTWMVSQSDRIKVLDLGLVSRVQLLHPKPLYT